MASEDKEKNPLNSDSSGGDDSGSQPTEGTGGEVRFGNILASKLLKKKKPTAESTSPESEQTDATVPQSTTPGAYGQPGAAESSDEYALEGKFHEPSDFSSYAQEFGAVSEETGQAANPEPLEHQAEYQFEPQRTSQRPTLEEVYANENSEPISYGDAQDVQQPATVDDRPQAEAAGLQFERTTNSLYETPSEKAPYVSQYRPEESVASDIWQNPAQSDAAQPESNQPPYPHQPEPAQRSSAARAQHAPEGSYQAIQEELSRAEAEQANSLGALDSRLDDLSAGTTASGSVNDTGFNSLQGRQDQITSGLKFKANYSDPETKEFTPPSLSSSKSYEDQLSGLGGSLIPKKPKPTGETTNPSTVPTAFDPEQTTKLPVKTYFVKKDTREVTGPLKTLNVEAGAAVFPGAAEITKLLQEAEIFASQNDHQGAEALFGRALAKLENVGMGNNPLLARCLEKYSDTLYELGKLKEALPLLRRLLVMQETVRAQDRELISTMHKIAMISEKQGLTTEADSTYKRAFRLGQQSLVPGDPLLAKVLEGYGNMLMRTGEAGTPASSAKKSAETSGAFPVMKGKTETSGSSQAASLPQESVASNPPPPPAKPGPAPKPTPQMAASSPELVPSGKPQGDILDSLSKRDQEKTMRQSKLSPEELKMLDRIGSKKDAPPAAPAAGPDSAAANRPIPKPSAPTITKPPVIHAHEGPGYAGTIVVMIVTLIIIIGLDTLVGPILPPSFVKYGGVLVIDIVVLLISFSVFKLLRALSSSD